MIEYLKVFIIALWPKKYAKLFNGLYKREILYVAIVILLYSITPYQSMLQDIPLWFTAVCPRCSRQFNTYTKMPIGRQKIASMNSP